MQRTDSFSLIIEAVSARLEQRHVASATAIVAALWIEQQKLGFVEIGQREIGRRVGLCVSTTGTMLRRLEIAGLVEVRRSRYHSVSTYCLCPPRPEPMPPRQPPKHVKAHNTLPNPETPHSELPAGRADAIKSEIKALMGQTFQGEGGLLRLLPAAKAKIATLRAELSALEISSPTTTPKQTGNDEKEKNVS